MDGEPRIGSFVNGAPRQRRYAPRSNGGCLTCRRRKKRCPGQNHDGSNRSAICDTCYRLDLACEWAHTRRVPRNSGCHSPPEYSFVSESGGQSPSIESNATSSPGGSNTSLLALPPDSIGRLTSAEVDERILMSYYIHCFVPIISVSDVPTSFFTSVYIPMAFSCAAIRSAILADASAHLAKSATIDRRQELLESSLRYQSQCHNLLQERITLSGDIQKDTLESLATILLLVGLEVQNGARTQKWISQLDCVRNAIRKHGGPAFSSSSWEASCIYDHFLYYDVMSLIMAGVTGKGATSINSETHIETPIAFPTLLSATSYHSAQLPWTKYLDHHDQRGMCTEILNSVHPLFGLSRDLFVIMQKIPHFKNVDGRPRSAAQRALFLELENKIMCLRFDICPYPGITGLTKLAASSHFDLFTLAETQRLAALIFLYRCSGENLDQLPILAQKILDLAERIPAGNPAEAGLTYPMFLSGAELSAEHDILRCAAKLISIRKRVNVMNIESVEKVLEVLWRERLNGGEHSDWEFLLKKWDWVINLG